MFTHLRFLLFGSQGAYVFVLRSLALRITRADAGEMPFCKPAPHAWLGNIYQRETFPAKPMRTIRTLLERPKCSTVLLASSRTSLNRHTWAELAILRAKHNPERFLVDSEPYTGSGVWVLHTPAQVSSTQRAGCASSICTWLVATFDRVCICASLF